MIAIVALIRETFWEALSKKIIVGYLILSAIFLVILYLVLHFTGMSQTIESLKPTDIDPDGIALREFVRSIQTGIGNTYFISSVFAGIFMTSGIIPSMMEKGTIDLLVSKPLSRTTLLTGKILASILLVLSLVAIFLLLSWIIIGTKTGIWNVGYLLSIFPISVLFFSLLSIVTVFAVQTQTSAIGMIVTYLYLSILSTILYSREQLLFQFIKNETIQQIITFLYQVLPKVSEVAEIATFIIQGKSVHSYEAVVSTFLFGVAMTALSSFLFSRKEF